MICKKFLLVLQSEDSVYVSGNTYDVSDLQRSLTHLSSIGVKVLDVLPVCIDLSNYEH